MPGTLQGHVVIGSSVSVNESFKRRIPTSVDLVGTRKGASVTLYVTLNGAVASSRRVR